MRKWLIGLASLCGVAAVFLFGRSIWRLPSRPAVEEAETTVAGREGKTPAAGSAMNWPRLRGPDGSGVSTDKELPTEWNDTKNLRLEDAAPWPGSSSPIVWDDRVFVTCYSGHSDGSLADLKRHLVCLHRATGKVLWTKSVAAVLPEDPYRGYLTEHGYASNSPVTDGDRIYVFFGKTGVLAFDFDGNQLWQTSVGTQSGNRRWGSAASLLVYGDVVIVNASEESRSIQALDRKTGEVVWKATGRSLELCYGTPLVVDLGKAGRELVIAVPSEIWGLNPDTGKLLWHAATDLGGNISPSVVVREDVVFATGGYPGTHTTAVRAGGRGDVTKTHTLWAGNHASYVPSPVVHGDHLYLVNDQGIAVCLEAATGTLAARVRLPITGGGGASRPVYASPLLANGRLYAVTRLGGTFVLKASPDLTRIAQNRFATDESEFNAAPAVSRGHIFLRSNRFLYCVGADRP